MGLSQRAILPSKILRESDVPNVKWSFGLSGQECQQAGSLHTSIKASTVPEITVGKGASVSGIIGKKPPPVLEWNPLVHTEWQLGVSFNFIILLCLHILFN